MTTHYLSSKYESKRFLQECERDTHFSGSWSGSRVGALRNDFLASLGKLMNDENVKLLEALGQAYVADWGECCWCYASYQDSLWSSGQLPLLHLLKTW